MLNSQSAVNTSCRSAGQVIEGALASCKVTSKVQVLVFPFPSSTVIVTVCIKLCPVKTVPAGGDCVIVIAEPITQADETAASLL